MQKVVLRYAVSAALAVVAACYLPDPCDEGQLYNRDRQTCRVSTSTTASGDDPNQEPVCDETQFGAACSIADDCTCDTDFCAVQPGQPEGFCTITGCLDAPEACGPGFFCLDITNISPEVGSLCVPQ